MTTVCRLGPSPKRDMPSRVYLYPAKAWCSSVGGEQPSVASDCQEGPHPDSISSWGVPGGRLTVFALHGSPCFSLPGFYLKQAVMDVHANRMANSCSLCLLRPGRSSECCSPLRGGHGHVQAWPCGFLPGPPLVCGLLMPLTHSDERLWTTEAFLKLCPAPLRLPENIYRAAGPGG